MMLRVSREYSFDVSIMTKEDSDILVKGKHEGVAEKSKHDFVFSFQVPPLDPTDLTLCKYIKRTYEILIVAVVGGPHRDLHLTMPITIGTVPIVEKR